MIDNENLGIGVRALVNGAWGFSASPYWELDEAEQLAKDAVAQARINTRVSPRRVDMGQYPVASGSWTTPIRIDPLAISLEEKTDFMWSFVGLFPKHIRGRDIQGGMAGMDFQRQECAVATTDGAYFTQTLYQSGGKFSVSIIDTTNSQGLLSSVVGQGITMAGAGWERILDAKLRDQIPGLIADAEVLLMLPRKPVQVGRYDIVCDAPTMAHMVNGTLGMATELDRTLGYEANAGGTSYLGPDPFANLGVSLGVPLLNVTGDRSMSQGLATVKWDIEGVVPERFSIVDHGVLVDYQTTREQANWLTSWYAKRNHPVRSHGCAGAESALSITQEFTPNLTLAAGPYDIGFDELVANTKRGLAITDGGAGMDFQSRGGTGRGLIREITDGKLGAMITGAGFLFSSTELWKTLTALGGASHREMVPSGESKGEPGQSASYSVMAVPGSFKDMAIIDVRRKV